MHVSLSVFTCCTKKMNKQISCETIRQQITPSLQSELLNKKCAFKKALTALTGLLLWTVYEKISEWRSEPFALVWMFIVYWMFQSSVEAAASRAAMTPVLALWTADAAAAVWLSVSHFEKMLTRAYTPGLWGSPHSSPKLVTPTR